MDDLDLETLVEVERSMELVRMAYERFFQGIDKRPPDMEYVSLRATIRRIREIRTVTNTGIKFRRDTVTNKFMVLSRVWDRTMKEIEEGRYSKDRFRANLHEKERLRANAAPTKPALKKDRGKGELDDESIAKLHKQLMMAKLECNESTKGITKETLAKSIAKTIPQLEKKYKGRKFEFKVVVEKGKTKLKAVLK